MTDNRGKIKTEPHSVVFVCAQSIAVSEKLRSPITSWASDPDVPDSILQFLADCEIKGWPVLVSGRTAYVYAPGVML